MHALLLPLLARLPAFAVIGAVMGAVMGVLTPLQLQVPLPAPPAPVVVAAVRDGSPPALALVCEVDLGALGQHAADAAIGHAGLSESGDGVDQMQSRARAAALLPDVHVRGYETAATARDYVSGSSGDVSTTFYPPSAMIEGSLTFHLDRLVYSGQEPRLERLRLERIEARTRLTQRVIEEMSRWSRACAEERDSPSGTDAHVDAVARRTNAAMALDVWTGGWFSQATRRSP